MRLGSRDLRFGSEAAALLPPLRLLGSPVLLPLVRSSSAAVKAVPRATPPICGGGSRAVHKRTEENGASLMVLRQGPLDADRLDDEE